MYSSREIQCLIILYGIAYIYSLHFAPFLAKRHPTSSLNILHERCIRQATVSQRHFLKARGSNYILGDDDKSASLNNCLLTFWGSAHVLLYLFIGYFCPRRFYLTFWIGVIFEIYEWYVLDCADLLDLFWNSIGFFVGRAFT